MTLYLALGTFVFFAGAIRVASHLGYPAGLSIDLKAGLPNRQLPPVPSVPTQ